MTGPNGTNPDASEAGAAGEAQLTVDAVGRRCPVPIIELARRITDVDVGAVVALVADDPAAGADIAAWCRMRGHELVGTRPQDAATAYLVRRLH